MIWPSLEQILWNQLVQISLVIVAIAGIAYFLRRRPHWAYFLWLLVLLKSITPPIWSFPMGLFSGKVSPTLAISTPTVAMSIPNRSSIDIIPAKGAAHAQTFLADAEWSPVHALEWIWAAGGCLLAFGIIVLSIIR